MTCKHEKAFGADDVKGMVPLRSENAADIILSLRCDCGLTIAEIWEEWKSEMTRLRALLERATPAPWTPSADEPGDVVLWGPTEEWMANIGNWARQHPEIDAKAAARQFCEFRDAADAELMAAMRDALPALLDVVEAAQRYKVVVIDKNEEYLCDEELVLRAALAKLGAL